MFIAALQTTLRLLLLRGGPEDFPFATTPRLTLACLAFAVLAMALPQTVVGPLPAAVAFALVMVLSLFVFLRMLLRFRKLENRFQQTFNALLSTMAALWLLAFPAWAKVLPPVAALQARLMADPTLGDSPEKLAALQIEMQTAIPPSAAFWVFMVCFWQFVVASRVLGQATGSGSFAGTGLAFLCLLNLFAFLVAVEPLLRAFGG